MYIICLTLVVVAGEKLLNHHWRAALAQSLSEIEIKQDYSLICSEIITNIFVIHPMIQIWYDCNYNYYVLFLSYTYD